MSKTRYGYAVGGTCVWPLCDDIVQWVTVVSCFVSVYFFRLPR